MALSFGRVEMPDIDLRPIVPEPNKAWDDLGPRNSYGVCVHRMIGSLAGTDAYFRNEARFTACTDFGIGLDGTIYQWVPSGSRASPWANGPANHLEGDGVAFVRKLGVGAVNRDLRSIELADNGQHLRAFGPTGDTAGQWKAMVQLIAFLADQEEIPWDQFPLHPGLGIVTHLQHWEFGPKECPFYPVRAQTSSYVDAVRGVLRAGQAGTDPDPVPPPSPVTPTVPWTAKGDAAFLRKRFGSMLRYDPLGNPTLGPDNKPRKFGFDPKGVISNAWLARSAEEDAWPQAEAWMVYADGGNEVLFSNGWVLVDKGDKAGWRWVTE